MKLLKEIEIIDKIKNWDKADIFVLRDLIREYRMIKNDDYDALDMSDLPSEKIIPSLACYPVWAMDKKQNCLVGVTANEIESLKDILD